MFEKYTIASENNPVWQMVEPLLFSTWAEGVQEATIPKLYAFHFVALMMGTVFFLVGFLGRLGIISIVLMVFYIIFPGAFSLSLTAIFPTIGMDLGANINTGSVLLYQLLGYVALIKSVLFLFGKYFRKWILETIFYLLQMLTGMLPLRWIAGGLREEKYLAQLFARSDFMSMFMPGSITAAPATIVKQWDDLIDLYRDSNREESRKKLENLCAIADHV